MMIPTIQTLEQYHKAYARSVSDPEGFWAEQASTFQWHKPWKNVVSWNFKAPRVTWFDGGRLNITENCLDRHLSARADQPAIIWEPNTPGKRPVRLTYRQLHAEVCRLANALKALGVRKNDRVCLYMPMTPELAIAVLACARIGAVHAVVFAGFSAVALAGRIQDAQASVVITADYNARGPKNMPVKQVVDDAIALGCTSVKRVIVHRNTGGTVAMQEGRDIWWHEAVKGRRRQCPAAVVDSEHMLFILYTSGSTGNPKGVVHTHGGYMVYAEYTFRQVFQYREGEVHWCTADIGWITGHSYILYGPLLAGATTLLFEGIPTYPNPGRFWDVIRRHKVNIFYTAPTAIRALMAAGNQWVARKRMTSLRVLGTVGEPINEEAWRWYHRYVGKNKCPIVDTWWQTETGGILISPLAGITPLKPCYATLPLPGVQPVLVDPSGNILEHTEAEGLLCIRFPWPGMLRTTYGDHERCRQTYFGAFPDLYFTGDGARRDADGYYRIIGRVDDVINVSGHRLGTAEIEDAINKTPGVVESAVVGFPHPIKGQGIYAYVIAEDAIRDTAALLRAVSETVTAQIGAIARPDAVQAVGGLPKTRSGKIMRRILRKIAEGDTADLGDTSTLLNPEVVDHIMKGSLR